MSVPEFREARRADLPAILALLADDALGRSREGDAIATVEAAFAEIEDDPNNAIFVLTRAEAILGCAQLTIIPGLSRRGAKRGLIEAVRIASQERGQGLGREFFARLIAEAGRRGCRMVQLTSDKRRHDAHRFYASLGFAPTHEGFKLDLTAPRESAP